MFIINLGLCELKIDRKQKIVQTRSELNDKNLISLMKKFVKNKKIRLLNPYFIYLFLFLTTN
jgi:hypothetical protein